MTSNINRQPILELKGIEVAFGSLKANDDVTISIRHGERRALIGPNGAGKTTLFNAIAGVCSTRRGKIYFEGADVTRKSVYRRALLGIGRTYQITNLLNGLSVRENLEIAVRGKSWRKFAVVSSNRATKEEHRDILEAMEACGIEQKSDALIKELSYGEQRQVELAMALSTKPSLLLLDEPAAGLSASERVRISSVISSLPRSLTLIMIEHDMELALGLAEYVTCLASGKVLVEDTPERIKLNRTVLEVYLGASHA